MAFEGLSILELRDVAKRMGVKNIFRYRKIQLAELLEELVKQEESKSQVKKDLSAEKTDANEPGTGAVQEGVQQAQPRMKWEAVRTKTKVKPLKSSLSDTDGEVIEQLEVNQEADKNVTPFSDSSSVRGRKKVFKVNNIAESDNAASPSNTSSKQADDKSISIQNPVIGTLSKEILQVISLDTEAPKVTIRRGRPPKAKPSGLLSDEKNPGEEKQSVNSPSANSEVPGIPALKDETVSAPVEPVLDITPESKLSESNKKEPEVIQPQSPQPETKFIYTGPGVYNQVSGQPDKTEEAVSNQRVFTPAPQNNNQEIKTAAPEDSTQSKRQTFQSREQRQMYMEQLDSGEIGEGILEIMAEGYGFLRTENYLQGTKDIYISPSQIKRFNLRPGDSVRGSLRTAKETDKFNAILFVKAVNGDAPEKVYRRPNFDDLRPIFPNEKLHLETTQNEAATRLIDLVAPIGKGQRGMIVSPPKAGKTVLLKKIANAITINHPDVHLIILLIDERPEEVSDMQASIKNDNADIVFSTFDETPEHHKKITEVVMERAQRLVEQGKDVVILLDSITRMSRAYNLTVPPGGRTLSGGLDPAALYIPKKFFGAARNIDGGGSLTVLATALVETGSRLDDMVFEEFKGTGNMELVLDRRLSEKRIFPAIDINKSGTRREDLLLTPRELEALYAMRRAMSNASTAELTEEVTDMLLKTRCNKDFIDGLRVLDKRYL